MKKLLWVGDATCQSGFAYATHNILEGLRHEYDVTVLGMNHRGDPHDLPYPVFSAGAEGDAFGTNRLIYLCDRVKPDVIVLQNDGWNIPAYMSYLRRKTASGEYLFPEYAAIPVVGAIACDGKHFQGRWLSGLQHAIFWTEFALLEAKQGGWHGPSSVVPLAIDPKEFYPEDQREARIRVFRKDLGDDVFIVGNVNRNQPRKRWDLTIKYFAEWINSCDVRNAYLFFHTAPTGDAAIDVNQLAKYYGILDRVAIRMPSVWDGSSVDEMRDAYNCMDVAMTTTQGEGWGLTTMEAMACGVPCIVPDWSALGEWALRAAVLVPCPTTAITYVGGQTSPGVIGGVPDEVATIDALDLLYRSAELRAAKRRDGLALVSEYRWEDIRQRYSEILAGVLEPKAAEPVEA